MEEFSRSTGELVQDDRGREIPDPQPLELPAGFKKPESLSEMVRRLTRTIVSDLAEERGEESFEESEDFNVEDDEFPSSPYEEVYDPRLGRGITVEEFHKNYNEYEQRWLNAQSEIEQIAVAHEILQKRTRPNPAEQSGPKAVEKVEDTKKV